MLSGCSDCSRVDAVKASANQLKLQVPQSTANGQTDPKVQSADRQLQSVDQQVKSGNAVKAEVALSAARSAVEQIQYTKPSANPVAATSTTPNYGTPNYGRLDVQA